MGPEICGNFPIPWSSKTPCADVRLLRWAAAHAPNLSIGARSGFADPNGYRPNRVTAAGSDLVASGEAADPNFDPGRMRPWSRPTSRAVLTKAAAFTLRRLQRRPAGNWRRSATYGLRWSYSHHRRSAASSALPSLFRIAY